MDEIQTALFASDYKKVHTLISGGMKWEIEGYMANQAFEGIVKAEEFELLDLLIEEEIIEMDIFEYDSFKKTIFEVFTTTPCTDGLIEYLEGIIGDVENIDDELEDQSWLGLAIENKSDVRLIELLCNSDCDINKINTKEQNYLFMTKDIEMTEFLINQGLDVNQRMITGQTAFFNVVASKDEALIQLYLDNGVDINIQDNRGETVYHVTYFRLANAELFALLASYDPPRSDQKNKEGVSLLMQICESSLDWESMIAILKILVDSGVDLFHEEPDGYANPTTASDILAGKSLDVFKMITESDEFDTSKVDNKGNSWLHKVCKVDLNFDQTAAKDLYRKVKTLLKAGADPSLKNDEDKSPIDYAQDDNLKSKVLEIMIKHQLKN